MKNEYDWRRKFAFLPTRMEDGRIAWLCWIEIKTDYMDPYKYVARWPQLP